jgi:hypothetical protein
MTDATPWAPWAAYLETVTDLRHPTRMDTALIESIMLWPDDETWRAKHADAAFVEFVGDGTHVFTREGLEEFHQLTRKTLPIGEVHKEAEKQRCGYGAITGLVLHRLIALQLSGEPPRTLKEIERESVHKAGDPFNVKTYSNQFDPVFRPVAHLWAAFIELAGADLKFPFPCPVARFGEFLAAAESFLLEGEAAILYRTGLTFLHPGGAFPLPPNLRVNPFPLRHRRT